MKTNLLKAKLKEIEKQAKSASEGKKRQLRMQYMVIRNQIRTLENKPKTFSDNVVDSLF